MGFLLVFPTSEGEKKLCKNMKNILEYSYSITSALIQFYNRYESENRTYINLYEQCPQCVKMIEFWFSGVRREFSAHNGAVAVSDFPPDACK